MPDENFQISKIEADLHQVVRAVISGDLPGSTPPGQIDNSKEVEAILKRVESLTSIVRTGWITVVLGCLYVWLTLASFDDADLFLPDRTLTMPIIQTEITAVGFFIFGPLVLMAAFFYFQLMLVRLWESYGRLRTLSRPDEIIDGLPIDERVEPWFLTILIPQKPQGFDWIAKIVGRFLCFYFLPLTVFAVGYRYLRAHEPILTSAHIVIAALALMSGYLFSRYQKRVFKEQVTTNPWRHVVRAIAFVAICAVFAGSAQWLTERKWSSDPWLQIVSPHAQLFRAELTTKPPGWDELKWLETNSKLEPLERCRKNPESVTCPAVLEEFGATPTRSAAAGLVTGASAPVPSTSPETPAAADDSGTPPPEASAAAISAAASPESGADADGVPVATDAPEEEAAFLPGERTPESLLIGEILKNLRGDRDLLLATLDGAQLGHVPEAGLASIADAGEQPERAAPWNCEEWPTDLAQSARDLRFAHLREAFLARSNLRCANLQNADLRSADLTGAVLEYADLRGADLSDAKIRGAKFLHTNLAGATLSVSFDYDANLSDAELSGNISQANFTRADLSSMTIISADMHGSLFIGTKLLNTILTGSKLQGSIVYDIEIKETTDLFDVNFSAAALKGIDLRNLEKSASTSPVDIAETANGSAAEVGATATERIKFEQIKYAFGDGSVKLPDYLDRPSHWPGENLDEATFFGLWQGWRIACGLTPWVSENQGDWLAKGNYPPIAWTSDESNCPPETH